MSCCKKKDFGERMVPESNTAPEELRTHPKPTFSPVIDKNLPFAAPGADCSPYYPFMYIPKFKRTFLVMTARPI